MDLHFLLVILQRLVLLVLLTWEGLIVLDEYVPLIASELKADRERDNVTDDSFLLDVLFLYLTTELAGHNRCTVRNTLIWVDMVNQLFIEVFFEHLAHFWDARRTTNDDDMIDLILFHLAFLKSFLIGILESFENLHPGLFELITGDQQLKVEIFVEFVLPDEAFDSDSGLIARRQLCLSLLAGKNEFITHFLVIKRTPFHRATLHAFSDLEWAIFCLKSVHAYSKDDIIEIATTETHVTFRGLDI